MKKYFYLLNTKKITNDRNIKKNKKNKINKPLSGSFAKVWTELSIPDLTKKVPAILNVKLDIDNTNIHNDSWSFFSNTRTLWRSAVKHSQGIKDIFSTGSQNQNPPQPNS